MATAIVNMSMLRENLMRQVIAVENLALDGVMEAPEQWAFAYQNAGIAEFNKAQMMATDALLFGRVTYQHLAAYWPFQTNDQSGVADFLNSVAKFVVSSTLQRVDWHNTTIISGDVTQAITDLKQQPGGNIVILGSAALVKSLMPAKLIDEYHLYLAPVVIGGGKRLFPAGMDAQTLQHVETKTFSTGVVFLRYQPATGVTTT